MPPTRLNTRNIYSLLSWHVKLYPNVAKSKFADLDTSSEVVVYAKLPRGFLISTLVGDYNPDRAISFKEGSVKHIYFVAETKGAMSSMKLREIEKKKSTVCVSSLMKLIVTSQWTM